MDDDEYCEISSQLDAREILKYLNNLGIRNINGEVLKYFITDLKKLIKYDLQHKGEDSARSQKSECIIGPERLHSASTFSSRIRSRAQDTDIVCDKSCQKRKTFIGLRTTHSAPNVHSQNKDAKPSRRACSCVRLDKKTDLKDVPKTTASNSNLIKVPKQPIKRKSDPVSLYHYYTSLWAKYKPNVPGENNWADLRWNIRQKMVGSCPSQASNKVSEKQSKTVTKKTQPMD